MPQRRGLASLPWSIYSIILLPFRLSRTYLQEARAGYELLKYSPDRVEDIQSANDDNQHPRVGARYTKQPSSHHSAGILPPRYRRSIFIWAMASLGTFSLGSVILFGAFFLFCLYNNFTPSIQWTRTGMRPITANELAGVYPIACHSHNDYWRPQPLATALLNGCISVETDVWLRNGEVMVGHSQARLHMNRTLSSMYIEPLIQLLHREPPEDEDSLSASIARPGIFDSDPEQTLTLVIDFKHDEPGLWQYVHAALDPLRRKGYLTHFNGSDVVPRPITIVMSGDAPFSEVAAQGPERDMFYDAPLQFLSPANPQTHNLPPHDTPAEATRPASRLPVNAAVYSSANSYYASGNFKEIVGHVWHSKLSDDQLRLIREHIDGAHARGLRVRYWGVPSWPLGIRNYLWRVLVREGVDVLSVDNVKAVAHDNWGPRKGGCMTEGLI